MSGGTNMKPITQSDIDEVRRLFSVDRGSVSSLGRIVDLVEVGLATALESQSVASQVSGELVRDADWTIEPHGPEGQFALYEGRNRHFHGARLCNLSDFDADREATLRKILAGHSALRAAQQPQAPAVEAPSVDHGICQGCGAKLDLKEIQPYGSQFCHVVPVCCGHGKGGECCGSPDPSPCGPVHRFTDLDALLTSRHGGQ